MAGTPVLTASDDRIFGETPEDGLIARVYGDPELAKLFAAAPELYEALKEQTRYVTAFLERDKCDQDTVDYYTSDARAALRKAEGTP